MGCAFLCLLCLLLVPGSTAQAGEAAVTDITAVYTDKAPVLDGCLDEAVWQALKPVDGFQQSGNIGKAAKFQTTVRVCRDKAFLYFGLEVFNPEMAELAKEPQSVPTVELDAARLDTLEWYLSDSETDYYWLCMNVWGYKADAHFGGYEDKPFDWNGKWQGKVSRGKDCWVIEAAIPFSDISDKAPAAGSTWLANFARTKSQGTKELSALNPRHGGFHYLGIRLHFEDAEADRRKLPAGD